MSERTIEDPEIAEYLDRRGEGCVLTTLDADGYPHSVALGYYRIGDLLYVGTPARTQKVRNAEANPHGSRMVAGSKASG
ncbi:MAG: pyridoxamine 5'-phosphate oxidase family protein, partial [Chloroflexi bacterium]|nr:pyridoxamine 5'-phosphate oxidase family protein [Chloroflexota bacterium]